MPDGATARRTLRGRLARMSVAWPIAGLALLALAVAAPRLWRGPTLSVTLTNRTGSPIEHVRFRHPAGEAVLPVVEAGETVGLRLPIGWRGPAIVPVDFRFARAGRESVPLPVRSEAGGWAGREVDYLVVDRPDGIVKAYAEAAAWRRFDRDRFFALLRQEPGRLDRARDLAHARRVHVVSRHVIRPHPLARWAREYLEGSLRYLKQEGCGRASRTALVLLIADAWADDIRRLLRRPRPFPTHTLPIPNERSLAEIPIELELFHRVGRTSRLGDGHP